MWGNDMWGIDRSGRGATRSTGTAVSSALAAAVAAALLLSGCGATRDPGPATTADRAIAGVHAVRLETSGDLAIAIGEKESLTIAAGSAVIDDLTSEVVDGALVLGTRPGSSVTGSVRYTLTVTGLDRLDLEGSGSATGTGVLVPDATVTVSGSGGATLSGLDLTRLIADLSGSGHVTVAGTAGSATVTVSGSGDFDGTRLAVQDATVDASGSGKVQVRVSGTLTAAVSGSGDVVYTGNPTTVQRDRSGSGDIVAG